MITTTTTITRLNRDILRQLLLIDRVQNFQHSMLLQTENIGCDYSRIVEYNRRAFRFPDYCSTDLRVINHLIQQGYISITIHKKPLPFNYG